MFTLKDLVITFLIYIFTYAGVFFILKVENPMAAGILSFGAAISYYYNSNKNTIKSLIKETQRDHLTDLYNPRYFNTCINEEITKSEVNCSKFSILLLDLNDFKAVNDTYGHLFGDEVLKQTGKLLMANTRKDDAVVRYGGDEFVILLPDTGETEANRVKQKLKQVFDTTRIKTPMGNLLKIKPSIGMAVYPEDGTDLETLLKKADGQLYKTKQKAKVLN